MPVYGKIFQSEPIVKKCPWCGQLIRDNKAAGLIHVNSYCYKLKELKMKNEIVPELTWNQIPSSLFSERLGNIYKV